jgi:hypothetical protein
VHHTLVRRGVSLRMTIHHRAMNLITAAEADTSQENNWHPETFTPGLSVLRPESMASAEITSFKTTYQDLNLRYLD